MAPKKSRSKSPTPSRAKAAPRPQRQTTSVANISKAGDAKVHTAQSTNYTFVLYAMLAGTFGALSGVAGKLSVSDSVSLALYFRVLTFLSNGYCTAQMWRYYLKALALGSTPTCQVINTATNFIVSAAVGFAVFGEEVNAMWCFGATLVVCGLGLIVSDPGVPAQS